MDVVELRRALAQLRAATKLGVADFAKEVGIDKGTVYRVEDVKEDPSYDPSASTVDAWIKVATGLAISDVLTRLQKLSETVAEADAGSVSISADKPTPLQHRTIEAVPDAAAVVAAIHQSEGVGLPTEADATLLESLAFTCLRAVVALRASGTVRSVNDHQPARRRTDPQMGGQDPPDIRSVK